MMIIGFAGKYLMCPYYNGERILKRMLRLGEDKIQST